MHPKTGEKKPIFVNITYKIVLLL